MDSGLGTNFSQDEWFADLDVMQPYRFKIGLNCETDFEEEDISFMMNSSAISGKGY